LSQSFSLTLERRNLGHILDPETCTTAALLTCLSFAAYGEKLRIVTEPWAPYVYEHHGAMQGWTTKRR
jgi:hypothetical protein